MHITVNLVVAQVINFCILMAILTFLYNKFIKPFMRKREEEIRFGFAQIEVQKKEAANLKQEYVNQLASIESDAQRILERAQEEANHRQRFIIDAAREQAQRMLDQARSEIEVEKQATLRDLQPKVALLSVDVAEHLMRRTITPEDNTRLIGEMLGRLQTSRGAHP